MLAAGLCLAVASLVALDAGDSRAATAPPLPERLRDTGLFEPGSTTMVAAGNLAYSPQYPLWSDGAHKRRWLRLPAGTAIDAARADAWQFPAGTRLWKEFGYERPVETRFIERLADGSWRYATYVWNAEGTDAVLASPAGTTATVSSAPGGRYEIPGEADCRACHEGTRIPVLGVSALQLSPDRDPLAPHAETPSGAQVNLNDLVALGLVVNLPAALLDTPPRIAAATPVARAALGYLHANCGHCHNDGGELASLELALAQQTAMDAASVQKTLRSTVGESGRYRATGAAATAKRIVPGERESSVLWLRMKTRNPLMQMPPLGTRTEDAEAVALIGQWIHHDLKPQLENPR